MVEVSTNDRVANAKQVVHRLIDDLVSIHAGLRARSDYDVTYERLRRWERRALEKLRTEVSASEADRLNAKVNPSFFIGGGDPIESLLVDIKDRHAFMATLFEEIERHPEEFAERSTTTTESSHLTRNIPKTRVVFIIHGHDETNVLRLERLVEKKWALKAKVLSNEPYGGRTTIEKFEDEAQDAQFAFALLTPDDFVQVGNGPYYQARPNVLLELGWFYGRLGRANVCILLREGTKLPSDLDGIGRVQFKSNVEERLGEIEKELKNAGLL